MLRVISPHLIVAASTALPPRGANAAVYLSGTGARYLQVWHHGHR